jgi:hypothetical protein
MNPGLINGNLDNGFFVQNMLKPDYNKFVWDYMGRYNVLTYFASRNNGKRRAVAKYGEVHDSLMELPVVTGNIASVTTISPTQLEIFFTNPTPGFVPTGNVTNNFAINTRARISYVDPNNNYIIIESLDDAQVLASGDWVTGTWLTQEWNTQPRDAHGIPSTYYLPSDTFNYCEKIRSTIQIYGDDDEATWQETGQGKFFYFAQEPINLDVMMMAIENRGLKGTRALWTPDQTPSNGGVVWAIKDTLRGGIVNQYFSPQSLQDFMDWIDAVANRTNTPMYNLTVFCGRGFINLFQTWTNNFITQAGINNTFGGESVKGIDVMRWQSGGVAVDLVMLPSLNSQDLFPNQSALEAGSVEYNTAIAIDMQQLNSIAASVKQPPLQFIYQGTRDSMIVKYQPGIVEEELMEKSTGNIAVTDGDNFTIQYQSRSGLNLMARNAGLWQPGA